jgi:molecular chaperone DnaK
MAHITGIDLGTTNSAAAILNEVGKPEIVPNVDGERITPSLILFGDDGIVRVGGFAKAEAGALLAGQAECFVKEIKRDMHELDARRTILGKSHSPADLSSKILKKTVGGVVEHRGEIGPVAISVPAYFQEAGRKATMEAGRLAGLDVVTIVNEPTAAALAYTVGRELSGYYLVFDLGGGTFDVTILRTHGRDLEILTTQGDKLLGGGDFDRELLKIFADEYRAKTGEDLCADQDGENGELRHKWLETAEKTKLALSKKERHIVMLSNEAGGEKVRFEIARARFEEAISTHLAKAEMLTELALDSANLECKDISEVLLVGGSTRIPAVGDLIRRHFNKEPVTGINPDEAVALGAAIHAGIASLRERPNIMIPAAIQRELEACKVTDVINHSYGTLARNPENDEMVNVVILKKDTPLPASKEERFVTAFADQRAVTCEVTQGEDTDPEFCQRLYETDLQLPPGRPAGCQVRAIYTCDENHVLHCHFQDLESGETQEARLDLKGERGDAAVARKKRDLDELKIE